MYRRWIGLLLLGVLVVGGAPFPRSRGADEKAPARAEKLPADLEFVSLAGAGFIALRPGDLLEASPIKQMPPRMKRELERMTVEAERSLGLPLAHVERVTFLLPSTREGDPVVLVRTNKDYDQDAVVKKVLGQEVDREKHGNRSLVVRKERLPLSFCALDRRTFAIGRVREMKLVLDRADARETKRPHAVAVEWAAAKHHVVVGASPESILDLMSWRRQRSLPPTATIPAQDELRPRPDEKKQPGEKPPPPPEARPEPRVEQKPFIRPPEPNLAELLDDLPPDLLPFKPILLAKSAALALDLGTETKARWLFTFADDETARDGETAVRAVLYVARELLGRLPQEMRMARESLPKLTAAIEGGPDVIPVCARRAPRCGCGRRCHAKDGRGDRWRVCCRGGEGEHTLRNRQ